MVDYAKTNTKFTTEPSEDQNFYSIAHILNLVVSDFNEESEEEIYLTVVMKNWMIFHMFLT